jgi:E3 ubiquitin-protein ligase UHRF1
MVGNKQVRLDDLSKLTKIQDVREMIENHFEVEPARQLLFYRGKMVRPCTTV